MSHRLAKGAQAEDLAFCPYEDVLGIGHSLGISSALVPGAGEPNFDSYVANPYETLKQRREAEVHRLLDKLPPATITLDPDSIGGILRPGQDKAALGKEANEVMAIAAGKEVKPKNKMKGKSKPSRRHKKKQLGVITAEMTMKREMAEKQKEKKNPAPTEADTDNSLPLALARFKRK